jgi:HTH-type transcriptional regulator / antitoxin HipB
MYPLRTITTMQLGNLLVSARKAKGFTQAELGMRVNLSQARISQLEMYPETMTAEQLLWIASVLDLEIVVGRKGFSIPKGAPVSEW